MVRGILLVCCCLMGVWLAGCDEDGGEIAQQSVTVNAELGPGQFVTPRSSFAEAQAELIVDPPRDLIDFTLFTTGISHVTAVDIRVGLPRENGPAIFHLFIDDDDVTFLPVLRLRLTPADLVPQPSVGVYNFAGAVALILEGRTYVQVDTLSFPVGELRGQLGLAIFQAVLSGRSAVPSVNTTASGLAKVGLNPTQDEITVTLQAQGLDQVRAVEIVAGLQDEEGRPIFTLFTADDCELPPTLTRTVTAEDLIPQRQEGVLDFPDAVNALLSGNAAIRVTTDDHPSGEIRGQIVPIF